MNTQATAEDVLRLFRAPVNEAGARILRSFVLSRGVASGATSGSGVEVSLCLGPRVGGDSGAMIFGPRV